MTRVAFKLVEEEGKLGDGMHCLTVSQWKKRTLAA